MIQPHHDLDECSCLAEGKKYGNYRHPLVDCERLQSPLNPYTYFNSTKKPPNEIDSIFVKYERSVNRIYEIPFVQYLALGKWIVLISHRHIAAIQS